jgi:hypothetical protein
LEDVFGIGMGLDKRMSNEQFGVRSGGDLGVKHLNVAGAF